MVIPRTSVPAPLKSFKISAFPLWVTATPTILSLFAPTSTRSTPIRFVSKVVVVPSTVKSPLTFKVWKVPTPLATLILEATKSTTFAFPRTSSNSSGSSVPIPTLPADFTVILFSLFVPIVKSSPSEVPIAKSSPSL